VPICKDVAEEKSFYHEPNIFRVLFSCLSHSNGFFHLSFCNIGPWDGALMGTCPNGFFSLNSSSSYLLKIVVFLIDKRDLVVEIVVGAPRG
jgi:hypothetical protein